MAVELASEPLKYVDDQDLVDAALQAIKRGASIQAAADQAWQPGVIAPSMLEELALIGFRNRVQGAWEELRSGRSSPRRHSLVFGKRHVALAEASRLAVIYLQSAQGRQIPLTRFTLTDWSEFRQLSRGRRSAWAKRDEMATFAIKALKDANVEVTKDLPRDVLAELNEMAKEAWS